MDDFNWIANLLSGIGVLIASIAAFAAVRSALITSKEVKLRTRPRVGIEALIKRSKMEHPDAVEMDALLFRFANSGALPAQIKVIDITIELNFGSGHSGDDKTVRKKTSTEFSIFPGSHADHAFLLKEHWHLEMWADDGASVSFTGIIEYSFGKDTYETEFSGAYDFSEQLHPPQFRNLKAK